MCIFNSIIEVIEIFFSWLTQIKSYFLDYSLSLLGSTALAEFYFNTSVHIIEEKKLLEIVSFVLLLIFSVLAVLRIIDLVLLSINVGW